MNKSIYEEAIDNTQTLLGLIILYEKNAKKKLDMLNQIEKALEQAQKQEKLLELYKKVASAIVRISSKYALYVIRESEGKMVEQIFNKIKELENE